MDKKLSPIPDYEDLYWVDLQTGFVYNKSGHQIKPICTDKGMLVELRKYGQRERVLIAEIIAKTSGGTK